MEIELSSWLDVVVDLSASLLFFNFFLDELAPVDELLDVVLDGLLLELAHLLDFVEVHHEALLVGVVFLDAFAAENGEVVGTVEVLYPAVVLVAYFLGSLLVAFGLKAWIHGLLEVQVSQ